MCWTGHLDTRETNTPPRRERWRRLAEPVYSWWNLKPVWKSKRTNTASWSHYSTNITALFSKTALFSNTSNARPLTQAFFLHISFIISQIQLLTWSNGNATQHTDISLLTSIQYWRLSENKMWTLQKKEGFIWFENQVFLSDHAQYY